MKKPLIAIHHLTINMARPAATLETFADLTPGVISPLEPFQRFTRSEDGTVVTDNKTGLQWPAQESAERMTFAEAEKHCAALRLGGFDDWRLPDLEELESIRDLTRHEPCLDTAFFKSNSNWVWSRTPCAWSSDHAWIVSFYYGYVSHHHRDGSAFVRAVRRVSPSGQ